MHLTDMDLQQLLQKGGVHCDACGHAHHCDVEEVLLGSGVASRTAEVLARHGIHHPFVVCDENTRRVAMAQVEASLKAADMPYVVCSLGEGHIEPDEAAVGALTMAFQPCCDGILAVGSGVITASSRFGPNTGGSRGGGAGTPPARGAGAAAAGKHTDALQPGSATARRGRAPRSSACAAA